MILYISATPHDHTCIPKSLLSLSGSIFIKSNLDLLPLGNGQRRRHVHIIIDIKHRLLSACHSLGFLLLDRVRPTLCNILALDITSQCVDLVLLMAYRASDSTVS
jgi:hypothetical protein